MNSRGAGRALLALACALFLVALARDRVETWIEITDLPPLLQPTSTEVRARDGTLLRLYTVEDGLWRMEPGAVDPLFESMLIAYEDRRFFDHAGVDALAALRAAAQALRHGRVVSGASTLTMQVARLLERGTTGDLPGKLRQMRVALALERRLDKRAILDLYLRLAPYGGNVEGVRAAALTWLGKEPGRLTPAEAAVLVALPQAPETRRPDRDPAALRAARDRVLDRAARAGAITPEDALAARRDPVPDRRRPMPRLAPHLADRVAAGGQGRHVLTLDADLQRRLEALVARHARGLDERISVAALVVDHDTGAVRAAVGARAYGSASGQGFVDMTRALRSPGSTLKPLVYGLAFDAGLAHPETLILDAPVMFGRYAPQNFDGRFRGEVTVREALQESLNVPVVSLTEALGPARVMAALRRAGVAAELPGGTPGLAISLGGLGVTLADMVALYAALARGGEAVPLRWHADASTEHRARVLSRSAAWHLGQVLSQVPPPGAYGLAGKVAFKTGTSYGHRDAWALGWDGTHTAGVWLGRPDGTPVPGAFGGEMAAPLLIEALALARQGPAALAPPPPEALLLANAELPGPLRRFGGRNERASLSVMFPPEGARLERGLEIPVRLRGGVPPFTLLVDGAVVATGLRRTEFTAPAPRAGFTTLSVIDAHGRSGRVTVELR